MGPEMPPEEVMSTSESISETGIAPLPTPNMPQNFERGGIVGYANGGGIDFSQTNIDDSIYNPNTNTMITDDSTTDSVLNIAGGRNYFPFNEEVANTYGMPKEPDVADYKAFMNQKKEAFGIGSQYYDDERAAIQEEKDLIAKRRKGLMPDAMIRAGLGIASGQNQNAFTNVAQGLTPAFEQYVKDDDMILKEEKLNRRENRAIDKAMRAEALGDMQGFEAYNKEIRATQLKLIEIDFDKRAKAVTAGVAADSAEAKKRKDAMDTAMESMKTKYGTSGALLTKFKTNKKQYDREFFKMFQTAYKGLGGSDPSVNEEFINSLIEMAPQPKGVSESTDIKNTPKTEIVTGKDGKKYRKLPNGNYTPV
tara:strand:- start:436 stop:1530 length:1095 start_codon:yes stop_codon:yes gene_type:complete